MKMKEFIVMGLFVLILISCDDMKGYKVLYGEEHLDDLFKIEVYYREPMSFGPHEVKIFGIPPKGKKQVVYEGKIYNDGKNLKNSNAFVKWLNDGAELSIRGEEQSTKKYKITYSGDKFLVEDL